MSRLLGDDVYDASDVREKLSTFNWSDGYRPSKNLIDSIIEQLWFKDIYYSIVSTPDYFEYLQQYLATTKPTNFKRIQFYKYLINEILKKNNISTKGEKALEKIGVIFELLHSDSIPVSDYEKLLHLLDTDASAITVDFLVSSNLAQSEKNESNNNEILRWKHHSTTEYLAAEYILAKNHPLGVAINLMVVQQEGVASFKSSWYGVLRFLLESSKSKEVLEWFVSFGERNPESIDEWYSDVLTSIAISDESLRRRVFKLVYDAYFTKKTWIPIRTRYKLGSFCGPEEMQRFREDIKDTGDNEADYIHRGNIVSIIDGLLESKSKLMTAEEKAFWKEKFIEYAKSENVNGVLQRDSLSALAHYKDASLIKQVAGNIKNKDSLVRQAFISFCYQSAPNSRDTIDYLVEGYKRDEVIYGRYGIYEVKTKTAICYLIEKFISDPVFLNIFLDNESIFTHRSNNADSKVIQNIRAVANSQVISLLKRLIYKTFEDSENYHADKSYFIKEIVKIIHENDSNFLWEIIEGITIHKPDENKIWHMICNYQGIFAQLVTKGNVERFFQKMGQLHELEPRIAIWSIYQARNERGEEGKELFEYALSKNLFVHTNPENIKQEDLNKKKYDEFLKKLNPAPGKYFPDVFEFYVKNKDTINKYWTENDKSRLIKLAIDEGIEKIKPKEFIVKIKNKTPGSSRQFNWTSFAAYYNDIIEIVQILSPEKIGDFEQEIIDYIPFAFYDGQKIILDTIPTINDEQLAYVNQAYLDRENDKRYLLPSSYLYVIEEYIKRGCILPSAEKVIKSFVGDPFISSYEQESALALLGKFASRDDMELKDFFLKAFSENVIDGQVNNSANLANELLINIYKDEAAIRWRFNEIKKRIQPFNPPIMSVVHEVSDFEDEFDHLKFASPLINLQDIRYYANFIDLLLYSFEQKNTEKQYEYYIQYIWKIVTSFVENLSKKKSFFPLNEFEKFVKESGNQDFISWYKWHADKLRKSYVEAIAKSDSVTDAARFVMEVDNR